MWGNKTRIAKKVTFIGPVAVQPRSLVQLIDTAVRQTYVELENSNIIPQNREITQNHRKNNQRFEEIQLTPLLQRQKVNSG